GIGLFDQPPNPGNTFDNFGNPNLLSEKAIHYALGGEWRPLDFLEFNTTLFYRDMYDLVSSTDEFIVDPETGEQEYTFFNNEGEGRAYGAEFLLRHYPNKRLFGWIAYTLSRSERLDLETGEWELFGFDQTHILTMVAGYNLPFNFDISARFRLVSGNPYTPIAGSVFNADSDSYSPVNGEPNSARNKAFNQLDIRVDKNFVFNRWLLGVYLDIQNIYNASNAEGVLYNYDYTESQPLNGLPIFPNLGVTAKF
ncbi:MAG: ligand-gated channel protein, partial [Myxococcota bacterium]|nr:ligand-gated channel protein [Myxococcota bacterium]